MVELEQRPSGKADREAIVVGAGLCDGESERAYTGFDPHIIRNVSTNVFRLRRFGVFFCRNDFCRNVRNPMGNKRFQGILHHFYNIGLIVFLLELMLPTNWTSLFNNLDFTNGFSSNWFHTFQSSREETERFVVLNEGRSDTGAGRVGLKTEKLVARGSQSTAEATSFSRVAMASVVSVLYGRFIYSFALPR